MRCAQCDINEAGAAEFLGVAVCAKCADALEVIEDVMRSVEPGWRPRRPEAAVLPLMRAALYHTEAVKRAMKRTAKTTNTDEPAALTWAHEVWG